MGAIVDFRGARGRKAEEGRRPHAGHSAEIVIFPGVRIERWTEEPAMEEAFEEDCHPTDRGPRRKS